MKTRSSTAWSPAKSQELYGFNRWGAGHFSVDAKGYVCVHPRADATAIRIHDVVEEAKGKGLNAPLVVRFQDLLRHRVTQLNEVFAKAIRDENYPGVYRGVFPIKVNQLREVVEEVLLAGKDHHYGLEAGSKPELMIALALHENNQRLIICNGYKDDDYIRIALLGRRLGASVDVCLHVVVKRRKDAADHALRLMREVATRAVGDRSQMVVDRSKIVGRGVGAPHSVEAFGKGEPIELAGQALPT